MESISIDEMLHITQGELLRERGQRQLQMLPLIVEK